MQGPPQLGPGGSQLQLAGPAQMLAPPMQQTMQPQMSPIGQPPIGAQPQQPAQALGVQPDPRVPAQPGAANPYKDMPVADPNRAMWSGLLMDMSRFVGSAGRVPMQGLSGQYYDRALEQNRRRRMDIEGWEDRQRTRQREDVAFKRQQQQVVNPYAEFSANEQDYQQWRKAQNLNDDSASRDMYDTRAIATAAKSGSPSAVREYEYFKNLTPEGQKEYLRVKRSESKYNVDEDRLASIEEAITSGKTRGGEARGLATTLTSLNQTMYGYDDLEAIVEQLPSTGPITGDVLGRINTDYQRARAMLYGNALRNIGSLSAQGIRLNPITENELNLLLATQPQLSSNREANLKIIADERRKIRRLMDDINEQIEWIDSGKDINDWRPKSYEPYSGGGEEAEDEDDGYTVEEL